MSAQRSRPVVFVTGCSSGIGRSIAKTFAQRGATVYGSIRKAEAMADLERLGVKPVLMDVTDHPSIQRAVDHIISQSGRIDILVNNAGINAFGPLIEQPIHEVRQIFETNVIGLVAVTQAVAPHMVRQRSGKIVNVSSVTGVIGTPFAAAYSASKAAVCSFSDTLRLELEPFGIRVLNIIPGSVVSEISANAGRFSPIERYRSGLYASIFDAIQTRMMISQVRGMPTDAFAERVVSEILRPRPAIRFFYAPLSGLVKWMSRLAPQWLIDAVFRKINKLDQLKKNIQSERPKQS